MADNRSVRARRASKVFEALPPSETPGGPAMQGVGVFSRKSVSAAKRSTALSAFLKLQAAPGAPHAAALWDHFENG